VHVIVCEVVSQALGEVLPKREPLLKVLNRLYDQLENHYERFRNRRYPEDPDFFDYLFIWQMMSIVGIRFILR